ncbi:MAG: hypothetical protein GWM92_01930 [Gemmatimonadetes bacterium]|nr:V-type ATPase subunit [Gemmatimonadota bacterium]NIR77237.1 V-type ATPase subunit [Gemmatimonadota bacterium]NIT85756.1 V-type ATPase subunit [Gemmatimonadota bacterium]NIU29581.1 V-type ATPase subunit [Gemmatimonadota bacterium]NIU34630.1 hypothetical protein [Gemmatimonadota bacterium]
MTFWHDLASRARGLASHLLGADERREMAGVPDLAGLARALAPTPYGAHLATARPSPAGIEEALRRRAARDLGVLARWAGPSRIRLLSVVFEDVDRRSLRALVRGAAAGAPSDARLRATLATPGLPEARLREAARAPTPEVLAGLLERWDHPLAPAVGAGLGGARPDLFRVEIELSRLWTARSVEATRRKDPTLRGFVRDTVDEENLRTALARTRSPRGHGEPPFLVGGRWLERDVFGAAIGAGGPGQVREILGEALAGTPLGSVPGALEDRTLEEAILDVGISRTAGESRLRPGGPAPVLLFVLGLRREVRAIRRLAWAVELGAPVEERLGGGRAA